jgi:hypothetical protein
MPMRSERTMSRIVSVCVSAALFRVLVTSVVVQSTNVALAAVLIDVQVRLTLMRESPI